MIVISKNTAKKLSASLLMSALFVSSSAIAADPQVNTTLAKEIATLQQQITDMNKKIHGLEVSQTASAEQAKQAVAAAAKMEAAAQTATPWAKGPDGYITISGSNTAIKIGGRVRGEMMYDGGPNMGDVIIGGAVPLKNLNSAAAQSGHTNASARSSRLNFATLTPTTKGDVKTLIEIDFFGGGTGTSYNPKIRHAYGTLCDFLVGQTDSVFLDIDATGSTIDANTILGGPLRQMQIRYTKELMTGLKLMTALEKPNSDYIGSDGTLYTSNDATGAKGKSSLPDLTAQLRWTGSAGYIAARGMVRQIQYKNVTDPGTTGGQNTANDVSKKATGWGVGLSGKYLTVGKSGIIGQINAGQGIGRYIPEIAGEAVYYNTTTKQFNVLSATNAIVGYEHYWTDEVRSNLLASYTRISPPASGVGFTPLTGTTRITQKIKKVFFNILYNPVKNVEAGVEFAHIRRDTMDNKTGSGNRVSVGVTYNF